MEILFYRYGSICEPDYINAFAHLGLSVVEETTELYDKSISENARIDIINRLLLKKRPAFVFTINFFPAIAEVCHIHNVLYLCQSVDCPLMMLFTKPVTHPTNRIFLFDKEQYRRVRSFNPDCIFHLPLAAATDRFAQTLQHITARDKAAYSADISFVGSLYSEKNPLRELNGLSDYAKGCIDGIVDSALQIYGCNLIEESIFGRLIDEFKQVIPHFSSYYELLTDVDSYALAHQYIGAQAAETERIRTLNLLAEHFSVELYTASDTSPLCNVHVHPPIDSLLVMPKVFHLSKINLNMTIKPIASGLPLRIFDILGCGGFLLTNYQEELDDYFEIGKELEAYGSMEELVEKCTYYLSHEEERKKIALQGHEAVKKLHSHQLRAAAMLRAALI